MSRDTGRPETDSELQVVFEKGMQAAGTIMLALFDMLKAKKFIQAGINDGEDSYVLRFHKLDKDMDETSQIENDSVVPTLK